jgi:hypothetical protein
MALAKVSNRDTPMPPPPPGTTAQHIAIQPIAGALAILLPGLGHWYLGYARRARLLAIGVLGMFVTGVFIGGIDALDRREDFPWFLGQALVGPVAFATDWIHQNQFKVRSPVTGLRSANPDETRDPATASPIPTSVDPATGVPAARLSGSSPLNGSTITPAWPPNVKGLNRMNELGTLFCTIAGMMNLICIVDAAFSRRRDKGDPA